MGLDALDDLRAHGWEHHRAADPRQQGTRQRSVGTGREPDQILAAGLHTERRHRDGSSADPVGEMAAEQAHCDEADAEEGQAKARMCPSLAQHIEREEGSQRRKADTLQADRKARTPNLADDRPERLPLPGRRRHSRQPMDGDKPGKRQERADEHETAEAETVEQGQAERPTGREGTIHAHSDKGDHETRPGLTHQADGPADHADHRNALAEAEQQAARDQHGVAGVRGEARPTGRQADQPRGSIDDQAALHAELAAKPIGPPALVVERFDIRRDAADQRRLALEDFCSVLDLPASAKYDGTIERVARGLRPLSTDPAADLDILFRRALFAWLIADGDMHLKNLALLKIAPPGARQFESVRFAPLYDAVTTRVFPGLASDRMALKLSGKDERLTPRDFLTLARTIELPIARAEETMANIAAATRKAVDALSLPKIARDREGAKPAEERVKAMAAERCGALA